MTIGTHPYTPETHALRDAPNGLLRTLAPMTANAADILAPQIAAIGPWAHYGFSAAVLRAALMKSGDGAIRYQLLCGGSPAGAVVICSPWLVGPYLQMLAVTPEFQRQGAGAGILDWYETKAHSARLRNVWLCVSGFNVSAQQLYQRHGYQLTAHLPGLLAAGEDELLMRKDLSARLAAPS